MILLNSILTGCQTPSQQQYYNQTPEKAIKKHFKIGVLLPLSGPYATIGLDLQRASSLSLLESGAQNITLLYRDTQGAPEHTLQAAQDLIHEGVDLILGPLFAEPTHAITRLLRRKHIHALSFSSDFTNASGGVFLMGSDPAEQMTHMVLFAQKKHKNDICIIVPKGPLEERAKTAVSHLQNKTQDLPHTRIITYNKGIHDFKELAEQMKDITFDALLIPECDDAAKIVSSFVYYDVQMQSKQLLGSNHWATKDFAKDPHFFGAWYPAFPNHARQDFEERFQKLMGHFPHQLASLAYDAVAIVITLTKNYATDPFHLAHLTYTEGFIGLDGLFRFLHSGTNERTFDIYEVTPSGAQIIQKAFKKF